MASTRRRRSRAVPDGAPLPPQRAPSSAIELATLVRAVDAWLAARLADYPRVQLAVGLSGGVDSVALLGILTRVRDAHPSGRMQLRALHVDHHLQPQSGQWARHCRSLAKRSGIAITVLHARIASGSGRSLEADARAARYALLSEALLDGEVLLTAHHAGDQLETVLLQLFRGAGIKGLAAMPDIAPFGRGMLARPLLDTERRVLVEWASAAGLEWIDDPTNTDLRFDRNFLRRELLPALLSRWPGAAAAVARSARHAAEGQQLLDAIARADAERAADGPALSVHALRALTPERRRNVLRYWIARGGMRLPDAARLREIAGPLLSARPDANPRVFWGGAVITRHGDRLRLDEVAEEGAEAAVGWDWKSGEVLELPSGRGVLALVDDPHGPIDFDRLPERVSVRTRQGGEHLELEPDGGRRSLKSLLQGARLDPTERSRLPIVLDGERVLAAGDRWIDVSIRALTATRHRSRLAWRRAAN